MAAEAQVGACPPPEEILDTLQKRMQHFCWPGSPILAPKGMSRRCQRNPLQLFSQTDIDKAPRRIIGKGLVVDGGAGPGWIETEDVSAIASRLRVRIGSGPTSAADGIEEPVTMMRSVSSAGVGLGDGSWAKAGVIGNKQVAESRSRKGHLR